MSKACLPDELNGGSAHPLGKIDISRTLANLNLQSLSQLVIDSGD